MRMQFEIPPQVYRFAFVVAVGLLIFTALQLSRETGLELGKEHGRLAPIPPTPDTERRLKDNGLSSEVRASV